MPRENVRRKPQLRKVNRRERYVPSHEPLARKWAELERVRSLSQKQLALKAKCTEGLISQLLSGRTKLTMEWALQFADYMRLSPAAIWADFPFPSLCPGHLDPDAIAIAQAWASLTDEDSKKAIALLLKQGVLHRN